jgi:ubiquinone/menaquinone biosynthesis C-methylase UbiE
MVGDARRTGGGAAELTAGLRAGYDAAAPAWAEGPGPVYARLAGALVAAAPVSLAGALVLDLGAGTGLAGRAALAAGARQVVAADLSLGMLRHARALGGPSPDGGGGWDPVAADAVALPFRDRSFDLVVAAFCLNHLDSLGAGLAEVRRVGAAIAASVFAPGWSHPAPEAVEEVLSSFGYQPPAWHASLSPGSRAGDPEELAAAAAAAGFTAVRVRTADVHTGLVTPAELASWRLGLAQVAPFLRSLDAPGRAEVRRAAEQAVADAVPADAPMVVSIVMLTAR